MISLTQRHVITLIDLIKDEENRIEATGMRKISQPGTIGIDNWDKEPTDKDPVKYLRELREMLESEINKATFSFGLNEKVESIQ